ncbi:MAG: hypothetical protein IKT67_11620 [Lachnospiraceae bacterium]|nr:hypothetical protein [Lachnospiraceae bacterium]
MKKLILFIKKWCVVPFCCFLLFYPAWILGMMIAWGLGMTIWELTGWEAPGIIVGMLITGAITSIPIIYKVRNSRRMKIGVKRVVIAAFVLFFAGVAWFVAII